MSATAANLIERVLPPRCGLRQWVLTFRFSWRRRLAQDGASLGRLRRVVVETVLTFYAARAAQEGGLGAKSGAAPVCNCHGPLAEGRSLLAGGWRWFGWVPESGRW